MREIIESGVQCGRNVFVGEEATLWATAYLVVGAMDQFEPSLYFSVVTYTTLGYGDISLSETWRLAASFEAGLGILMFGWTTAVLVAVVHRLYNLGVHEGGDAP